MRPLYLCQLLSRDVSVTVSVEYPECLLDVVAAFVLLDLLGHHDEELLELDTPVPVHVHLVNHVLELGLSGILTQGSHHRGQFLEEGKLEPELAPYGR